MIKILNMTNLIVWLISGTYLISIYDVSSASFGAGVAFFAMAGMNMAMIIFKDDLKEF